MAAQHGHDHGHGHGDGQGHAAGGACHILWEGQPVRAEPGDTVAVALWRAGVRVTGRSRKFHRPLGVNGVFPAGAIARVNGLPNVRLDACAARPGLDVRAQNVWPNLDIDLLKAARLVPRRWLRGGFEHTNLLPSGRWPFEAWERLLRFMAGGADPPAPEDAPPIPEGARIRADVAVVGGGPAGRRAAIQAAAAGRSVVLVARGDRPGRYAEDCGVAMPALPEAVRVLAGCEAFGLYERGRVLGAAPRDGGPAALIDAERVVLAVGRRSCPPLVQGADLPGVMDVQTALDLARRGVAPGRRIVLIGTGNLTPLADRFRALGFPVVAGVAAGAVRRIRGREAVTALDAGESIACDAVIHAGPWRAHPALAFQARAAGELRLLADRPAPHVEVAGDAALEGEAIVFGPALDDAALVCPCMDVTVAEMRELAARGETHVEVVKRLTSAGMGPCQGFPCWDQVAAVLHAVTTRAAAEFGHPTYRAPRGALTLAQAAGLAPLVDPRR